MALSPIKELTSLIQKGGQTTSQATTGKKITSIFVEGREVTPEEIGYKAYNSLRVRLLIASATPKKQYKTRAGVPDLKIFFDKEVKQFLNEHHAHWKELFANFKKAFSQTKTLNGEATQALQELREFLIQTFPSFPIQCFVEDKKALMMMRSSGQGEDSPESSNPGGNTSVAALKNSPKQLRKAAAVVVSDYFSMRSRSQALSSDEDITQEPKLSFFCQLMVGELEVRSHAKEIPSCGVYYSREPLGRTPGVSTVQAGLGHNQGIVEGSVAYDTYYRDSGGITHALICKKPSRLAPVQGKLKEVVNPQERSVQPSLPQEALELLDELGRELETEYGQPVDIEWVYDPVIDYLWIVQTRPICFKPMEEASLLRSEFNNEMRSLDMEVIVAPAAAVVVVDHPSQIIEGPNLETAQLCAWIGPIEGRRIIAALQGSDQPR